MVRKRTCLAISVLVAGFIQPCTAAAGTYKIAVIMAASRSALLTDLSSLEKVHRLTFT